MQRAGGTGTESSGAQFVVAVFDDWDTLCAVLVELEAVSTTAVLHSHRHVPPKVAALNSLKQMTELRFDRSRQRIACTVCQLAEELSARLASGTRTLAETLHDWLSSDQVGQLEGHLEKGHLILCVQLSTPEDFSVVCGKLVQASPHMVELCNIKFRS